MAKVISLCGLVCTGKSTYAKKLCRDRKAALLSVDEITLAMFPDGAGDMLDTYVERTEKLVFAKACEYFAQKGVVFEIHYITVPREEWLRRIEKRNSAVMAGEYSAYYVDEGLAEKCLGAFEEPQADEEVYTVSDDLI